jgi:hypothetical protein
MSIEKTSYKHRFNESLLIYEGIDVEEATLTTQRRENLPSSAFCGPSRTYPAHDENHVRNALTRLAEFKNKLNPKVHARILLCLKRRASRMGIEVEETAEEEKTNDDELIEWYLKKIKEEKKNE